MPKPITTREIALIQQYRKEGVPIMQIVALLGRSRSTVGVYSSAQALRKRVRDDAERWAKIKADPETYAKRSEAYRLRRLARKGGKMNTLAILLTLSGCCTSTLQPGCDPQPKWTGYVLEDR